MLGLLYDALRPFRMNKWMDALCDFSFWICAFFLSIFILTRANAIEFRLFSILGFFLGYALYYFTLGKFIRALIGTAIKVCRRFCDFLAKMLG